MKRVNNLKPVQFLTFLLLAYPFGVAFAGGTGVWPFKHDKNTISTNNSANLIPIRANENQVIIVVLGVKPASNYKTSLNEDTHGMLPDPLNPDNNKFPVIRFKLAKQEELGNPVMTPFVTGIILNSTKDSFWFINGEDKPELVKIVSPD